MLVRGNRCCFEISEAEATLIAACSLILLAPKLGTRRGGVDSR